jgi:hypothetical protein
MKGMMQMQIDVKPLDPFEWLDGDNEYSSGDYTYSLPFGSAGHDWAVFYRDKLIGNASVIPTATDIANAHHAAHVRAQVAGVTLTDDEAYAMIQVVLKMIGHGDTKTIAAVQAAFAALMVTGQDDPKGGA